MSPNFTHGYGSPPTCLCTAISLVFNLTAQRQQKNPLIIKARSKREKM